MGERRTICEDDGYDEVDDYGDDVHRFDWDVSDRVTGVGRGVRLFNVSQLRGSRW